MPADEVEEALKRELRVKSLGDVFEWIDLEKPLGSASIAQVHKAKLRRYVATPSTAWNILTLPVRLCCALYSTFWPAPVTMGRCRGQLLLACQAETVTEDSYR